MTSEQKAEEILNYCEEILSDKGVNLNNPKEAKLHNEMIKQIEFLIDTD